MREERREIATITPPCDLRILVDRKIIYFRGLMIDSYNLQYDKEGRKWRGTEKGQEILFTIRRLKLSSSSF